MAFKIVPTEVTLKAVDLHNHDTFSLIQHAEQSAAADANLTIRQALKKYKKVRVTSNEDVLSWKLTTSLTAGSLLGDVPLN
jgi:hypothetical protein